MWQVSAAIAVACLATTGSVDGNRLSYLDDPCNPYWPALNTPAFTTPQWVQIPGVQAVIVLAIDDLRRLEQHERFLRPIIERMKTLYGRAPISIMANGLEGPQELLERWQQDGLSIETHTAQHRCPPLQNGLFEEARRSFTGAIDAVEKRWPISPVAFRVPCCDSMNSVSPRYFAHIFTQPASSGTFLRIDSSVFCLFTPDDKSLPRQAVLAKDCQERFRRYIPKDRVMTNYVENYPYPYLISHWGRNICWELPVLVPSDWEAQHANGPNSPRTVDDWKAAIDILVAKQGAGSICFHPHGWIRPDQIIELIDYVHTRYGHRVQFLTFRDVLTRLETTIGAPIRTSSGHDNGVRLLDVNNDGYMDVVVANTTRLITKIWNPKKQRWQESGFPVPIVWPSNGRTSDNGVRFGVLGAQQLTAVLKLRGNTKTAWLWLEDSWQSCNWLVRGLPKELSFATSSGIDRGGRLRDVDGDGSCELIVLNPNQRALYRWHGRAEGWQPVGIRLPDGITLVDARGQDAGLRLVDLDADRDLDLLLSNAKQFAVLVTVKPAEPWAEIIVNCKCGIDSPQKRLPPFVLADGTNNGAWFNHESLWFQNEHTGGKLPGHIIQIPLSQLLQWKRDQNSPSADRNSLSPCSCQGNKSN